MMAYAKKKLRKLNKRGGIEGLPMELMIIVVVATVGTGILVGWMGSIDEPDSIGEVTCSANQIVMTSDTVKTNFTVTVTDQSGDALKGATVVLFGCGGDRDRKKRPLMAKAAASLADYVYVTSDNPRTEKPEDIIAEILTGMPQDASYTAICDRAEAIKAAISSAREGDIILIAGKGHEDYQEINGVKHPFDDRIVAAECL